MARNNPIPAAIALVRVRRVGGSVALLGIVRKLSPAGGLALPGGYVDEMETAKTAVARELWEETRFITDASQWRLFEDRISAQNRLLLFCEFAYELPEQLLGQFFETKEVTAVFCITEQTDLCFPNHQTVARAYLVEAARNRYPEFSPVIDSSPAL